MEPTRFTDAKEIGEIVNKDGYHQPGGRPPGYSCNCTLTTEKGAYRDISIRLEDTTVHYYHQNPIVVQSGDVYRLSSCGWQTSTTKERINRYLPTGYRVYQDDFTWYLDTPEETLEFRDGMEIKT